MNLEDLFNEVYEIFKCMLDIKKITNPDTKLSELTLNDLVAILRYKGVKI